MDTRREVDAPHPLPAARREREKGRERKRERERKAGPTHSTTQSEVVLVGVQIHGTYRRVLRVAYHGPVRRRGVSDKVYDTLTSHNNKREGARGQRGQEGSPAPASPMVCKSDVVDPGSGSVQTCAGVGKGQDQEGQVRPVCFPPPTVPSPRLSRSWYAMRCCRRVGAASGTGFRFQSRPYRLVAAFT